MALAARRSQQGDGFARRGQPSRRRASTKPPAVGVVPVELVAPDHHGVDGPNEGGGGGELIQIGAAPQSYVGHGEVDAPEVQRLQARMAASKSAGVTLMVR